MKRTINRSLIAILAAIMMFGVAVPAFAASKTVKNMELEYEEALVKKKATTVKTGTTKLTVKGGEGYIRFRAPKTKTYKFTFSNFKAKDSVSCFVRFCYSDDGDLEFLPVSTKGGKSAELWMAVNGADFTKVENIPSLVMTPLKSRTGSVKLKKNQNVYIYFYNPPKKTTCKLVIK